MRVPPVTRHGRDKGRLGNAAGRQKLRPSLTRAGLRPRLSALPARLKHPPTRQAKTSFKRPSVLGRRQAVPAVAAAVVRAGRRPLPPVALRPLQTHAGRLPRPVGTIP